MQNKSLDKKIVDKIVSIYADAWVSQDPEKIISIFTPDAIYCEDSFEKPFIGHQEIKKYWEEKVVEEQSDIHFKLLNIYIDGNVAIVEWDADFVSNKKKKRIHIREVAILEIIGRKIKSLREYWHMKEYSL
jgi:ketosteroid isomerase-like protein